MTGADVLDPAAPLFVGLAGTDFSAATFFFAAGGAAFAATRERAATAFTAFGAGFAVGFRSGTFADFGLETTGFEDFAAAERFGACAALPRRAAEAFGFAADAFAVVRTAGLADLTGFAAGTAFFATTCFEAAFFGAGFAAFADGLAGAAFLAGTTLAATGDFFTAFGAALAFATGFAGALEALFREVTLSAGFTGFLAADLAVLAFAGEFLIESLYSMIP